MSDRIRKSSLSHKAGRGIARALRAILGRKNLDRARESARVLRDEYRAGRREAEDADVSEPPRDVPHRVVRDDEARDRP